jgi:hypothetical protein
MRHIDHDAVLLKAKRGSGVDEVAAARDNVVGIEPIDGRAR